MTAQQQSILSPFREKDADTLVAWIESRQELLKWAGPTFRYPMSASEFRDHLRAQPDNCFYPLCLMEAQTDALIAYGEVNVAGADDPIAADLSRIIVDPVNARGQGVGLKFVALLLRFCFDELGLTRVGLNVYTHNEPAVRCYLRAGFLKEGRRRQVLRYNGVYWDSDVMGILKDDYCRSAEI